MHNIYLKDLLEKCDAKLVFGNENVLLDSFSFDTRTMSKNDVFIGLKGESFDGSALYKEALEMGALGCIINSDIEIDESISKKYPQAFIVKTTDPLKCIQKLASYKRSLYNIPVIAVTGSVGKTSTKDIIASVMSEEYNTLKTDGNFNNHIGLPLTILKLKDHEALVVEMGMNNLGEISVLSKIAKPTVAVITNIGTAHIGNLGSRANILKAKLEILDGMNKDGVLVLNNDNDLLNKYVDDSRNIVTYGINNKSTFMATDIKNEVLKSTYYCMLYGTNELFEVNVPGNHFVLNSLCAISVGSIFNISKEKIKNGIKNFTLTKNRMDIESINGYFVINDCYNANLDSMQSAISYLKTLDGRKIAVLGDMLELGEYSEKLHREVGKCLFENKIDLVVVVGDCSKYIKDELNSLNMKDVYSFDNNKEAISYLETLIKKNDNILIKASHGMHFNEIYDWLKTYN